MNLCFTLNFTKLSSESSAETSQESSEQFSNSTNSSGSSNNSDNSNSSDAESNNISRSSSSDHLDHNKRQVNGTGAKSSDSSSDDLIFEYSYDPNNPTAGGAAAAGSTAPKKAQQQVSYNRCKSAEAPGRKLVSNTPPPPSLLDDDDDDDSSSSGAGGGFFRRPVDQAYDYSSFSSNATDLPPLASIGSGGKMGVAALNDLSLARNKLDANKKTTTATASTTTLKKLTGNGALPTQANGNGKRLRTRTKSNGESLIVLYIQMRLCDFTLRYWMNNRNQEYFATSHSDVTFEIDDSLCMRIFQQIVSGVEYIHSKSIIHRDLKVGLPFFLPLCVLFCMEEWAAVCFIIPRNY